MWLHHVVAKAAAQGEYVLGSECSNTFESRRSKNMQLKRLHRRLRDSSGKQRCRNSEPTDTVIGKARQRRIDDAARAANSLLYQVVSVLAFKSRMKWWRMERPTP